MAHFHSNALIGAGGQGGAELDIQKSVRFNRADSPYLNRTPSSAGNTQTWTWSGWVKYTTDPNDLGLFTGYSASSLTMVRFKSHLLDFVVEGVTHRRTSAFFRDPSAWYHIVWAFDSTQSTASNRSRLYINGVEITDFSTNNTIAQNATTGVNSTNVQLIGATSTTPDDEFDGYMADVYLIDGQQLDCTAFGAFDDNGVWQPAVYSGGSFGTNGFHLFDFAKESGIGNDSSGNDNDFTVNNISEIVPTGSYTVTRAQYTVGVGDQYDPYASVDGNFSTGFAYADRGYNNNGLSFSGLPQATQSIRINCNIGGGTTTLNANHGSGDVRTFTASATDTGIWKTMSGTVSPSNPYTLTKITGDGGNQTQSYFALYAIEIDGVVIIDNRAGANNDVMRDVPVNGDASDDTGAGGQLSSNYATLNPLAKGTSLTMTNGDLSLDQSSAGWDSAYSTIFLPTGKWYAEFTIRGKDSSYSYGILVGLAGEETYIVNSEISSGNTYAVQNMGSMVKVNHNSGSTNIQNIGEYAVGDVLQLAYDADNGKLYFGRNNTWINSGNPSTGSNPTVSSISGTYCLAVALLHTGDKIDCNFGQRAWAYSAPTNFKAVCTSNLPTPTIADGSTAFDIDLYTGTGSTHERSEFSFSPDLVWIKQRNTTRNNLLFDTVRGANKFAVSNSTGVPGTGSGMVTSFDSDGFTVGNSADVNQSSGTFVAWCWDAGTSTVSNTNGSITTQVRANASAGFSIVSWTGTGATASIGHGLNSKPQLVITKNLAATASWVVDAIGVVSTGTDYLLLNTTQAAGSGGSTADNSVVNILQYADRNGNGNAMIAYCFTSVAGYSSIGTYTGNGSTEGTFRYTGFRPKFIMIKGASSGGSNYNWAFVDTERSYANVANHTLAANLGNGESYFGNGANVYGPSNKIDILSNGFRLRENGTWGNNNGVTYIYIAFAENPFQANGGLAR